ncbi:MAG: tRNA pseudouridine(38-40) synthase TruA [Anaerolineae bacterium]|nr:tRNA pseudouridine(38-40) synthase TruA [Anaerolineae bacterium]
MEYDGTDYAGFQLQRHGRTVQGELEKGLAAIVGRAARVIAAGRTDAGVHAWGQVVHLRLAWAHSLADLPRDVAIRAVAQVPAGFHARFSARSRVYRYQIDSEPVRSPLLARYAWHVRRPLDVARMEQACAGLVGRRDLAALGPAPSGDSTVREVLKAHVWAAGRLVCLEVEADAFLQHMMRRLAAMAVEVGLGRLTAAEFDGIIRARDPHGVPGMAPPNGLFLVAVRYDPDVLQWSLPSPETWQKESCFA